MDDLCTTLGVAQNDKNMGVWPETTTFQFSGSNLTAKEAIEELAAGIDNLQTTTISVNGGFTANAGGISGVDSLGAHTVSASLLNIRPDSEPITSISFSALHVAPSNVSVSDAHTNVSAAEIEGFHISGDGIAQMGATLHLKEPFPGRGKTTLFSSQGTTSRR